MHHKCPSKEGSSGILVASLEDRDQRGLDFVNDKMEDASKSSERDKYETARQKFSAAKERTEHIVSHDDETRRTRRSVPVSAVALDDVVVDDVEDEEDASDMVMEEEDEVEHFVTSRHVLTHNNNGSLMEKKSRLRKPQEIRRVIRLGSSTTSPPASMIVTNPLPIPPAALVLPEQTEPEDLSMSTGNSHRLNHNGYRNRNCHSNSHSSGDSRSPSSGADEEEEEDDLPPSSTGLFLQHGHPKFRRQHQHLQRSNGTAPVS
jgi:hypothetical protein